MADSLIDRLNISRCQFCPTWPLDVIQSNQKPTEIFCRYQQNDYKI
jgi:hypothetical protein